MRASRVVASVRDLEKTVDFYSAALGLGPFETREIESERAEWRGRPAPARLRTASAPLGVCEMELIEVLDGRPPHRDFLDERGEGLNHLCLEVHDGDSYMASMARLAEHGIDWYWGYPDRGFAYVESQEIGGVTFEILRGRRGKSHVGLAVEDLDATTAWFGEAVGLDSWYVMVAESKRAVYGPKRIDATFKAGFAQIGECRLELVEVLAGDGPHADHLATRGEGMSHFCIEVEDLDAALSEAEAKGLAPTWTCPEAGLAYLDTARIGGTTFGLREAGA